ncbi:sensor histidine kinase [Kitasatospora sp. NPDC059571]|uniref:sensor histidine kinase n=1 Tax=Kitasatospora sp. NPDC059571 TaxID=3346871 RepID=UPI0036D14A54
MDPGARPRPGGPPGGEDTVHHPEDTAPPAPGRSHDPGAARLALVLDLVFLLLLGASLARYLGHHAGSPAAPWVIAGCAVLAVLQPLGPRLLDRLPRAGAGTVRRLRIALLGAVAALWAALVVAAPSFAWCAVPLIYTALRTLPARAAIPLVAALTALVTTAQARLPGPADATLLILPPAVAVLATAVFLHMRRQTDLQRTLVDDLVRTRRELAATERREGTLAERERLAREIHDTLAQGLSSQQMLLQAAELTWDGDPATARRHVRSAVAVTTRNLADARRFVHDLAPAELAGDRGLDQALRALAERESTEHGLPVRFHLDGTPGPLPAAAQAALLRIAQGALANVREHAGASRAVVTLTYLDDQVVLDVADDGRGFRDTGEPAAGRGHGLPAMRARLRQLGGTLTLESTPGEGTVLAAAVPLDGDRP